MKQNRIFLSPPHLGCEERRFIDEAFRSNFIAPLGPMVDAFEQEFCQYSGIAHCLAVSSGTAAIHLALRHLNIRSGDEVFASSLTFIGSITPILFQDAIPVFIDCDRKSWNMDPDLLEDELERSSAKGCPPKAVIPTDLYGQCCDYNRIYSICKQYKVPVVMDAAEAVGASYFIQDGNWAGRSSFHSGKGAKAAVFSFNGNKIITTSGGGILASEDESLIDHARFLSQQAREPFPHYEHTEIGYNYRLSNILAAIGRGQLKVLDSRVHRKREIFKYYVDNLCELPGIEFMPEADYGRSSRWLTVVLISPGEFGVDREQVRLALEAANIESRPVWKPMHLQPVFKCSGATVGSGKKQYNSRAVRGNIAKDLFDRGLCLPSGTSMTEADLERVVSVIRRIAR